MLAFLSCWISFTVCGEQNEGIKVLTDNIFFTPSAMCSVISKFLFSEMHSYKSYYNPNDWLVRNRSYMKHIIKSLVIWQICRSFNMAVRLI